MLKIRQISYCTVLYSGYFTYFTPKNKKIVTDFSYHNSSSFMVPETGIEPVWNQLPQDFKSCASTYSATRAL